MGGGRAVFLSSLGFSVYVPVKWAWCSSPAWREKAALQQSDTEAKVGGLKEKIQRGPHTLGIGGESNSWATTTKSPRLSTPALKAKQWEKRGCGLSRSKQKKLTTNSWWGGLFQAVNKWPPTCPQNKLARVAGAPGKPSDCAEGVCCCCYSFSSFHYPSTCWVFFSFFFFFL